jgi:hypothetical protein
VEDNDVVLEAQFLPFCPKCGTECEARELRRPLDSTNWKKVVVEAIYYCPKCDNYWGEGLVEKGYK